MGEKKGQDSKILTLNTLKEVLEYPKIIVLRNVQPCNISCNIGLPGKVCETLSGTHVNGPQIRRHSPGVYDTSYSSLNGPLYVR